MMVPVLKITSINATLEFYQTILGCSLVYLSPDMAVDPAYGVLQFNDDEFIVSSHAGDGVAGSVVMIFVDDVEDLYNRLVRQGLDVSQYSDSPAHSSPVKQTWGTTEFYVDDPDGNKLRFVQRE